MTDTSASLLVFELIVKHYREFSPDGFALLLRVKYRLEQSS